MDDNWNIDGDRNLSEPWTSFTQLTILNEKPLDGFLWARRRLTKIQATTKPGHLWPEILSGMSTSSSGPWRHWSSTMRDGWEASISLIRMIRGGSKQLLTTRGKSWNFQWKQPCPESWRRSSTGRLVADPTHGRSSRVYEKAFGKNSAERSHCWKGVQLVGVIIILCTSSFLCLEQWKSWMQKPLWIKDGSSSKHCQHGKWPKYKSNKEVIQEAQKKSK